MRSEAVAAEGGAEEGETGGGGGVGGFDVVGVAACELGEGEWRGERHGGGRRSGF